MITVSSLVEPKWLEEYLKDDNLRVNDATVQVKLWPFFRVVSGRRNFKWRHIAGAVFPDLLDISDRSSKCGCLRWWLDGLVRAKVYHL